MPKAPTANNASSSSKFRNFTELAKFFHSLVGSDTSQIFVFCRLPDFFALLFEICKKESKRIDGYNWSQISCFVKSIQLYNLISDKGSKSSLDTTLSQMIFGNLLGCLPFWSPGGGHTWLMMGGLDSLTQAHFPAHQHSTAVQPFSIWVKIIRAFSHSDHIKPVAHRKTVPNYFFQNTKKTEN